MLTYGRLINDNTMPWRLSGANPLWHDLECFGGFPTSLIPFVYCPGMFFITVFAPPHDHEILMQQYTATKNVVVIVGMGHAHHHKSS